MCLSQINRTRHISRQKTEGNRLENHSHTEEGKHKSGQKDNQTCIRDAMDHTNAHRTLFTVSDLQIFSGNQDAIQICTYFKRSLTACTKHVKREFYFIRHYLQREMASLAYTFQLPISQQTFSRSFSPVRIISNFLIISISMIIFCNLHRSA